MKVSVVISSLWVNYAKVDMLHKCIESLEGADEILALVVPNKTRISFVDGWNRVAQLATGDYIIYVGDSNFQTEGNLTSLCVPGRVTYPKLNGKFDALPWVFCTPRDVYNEIGLYDMRFNEGCHWEETDFWRRVRMANIPIVGVGTVNFDHPAVGSSITQIEDHISKKEHNKRLYFEKWGDNDY